MSDNTDKIVSSDVKDELFLHEVDTENEQISSDNDDTLQLSGDEDTQSSWASSIVDSDLIQFQKINPYIKAFPNFQTVIKSEAKNYFQEIKQNLVKAIYYNETRPGLLHWTNRLEAFISEYGFFFTKDEHLQMIKLYLSVLFTPDLDFPLVEHFSNILIELLKKWDQLSRKELVIDWKPLYKIHMRISDVHNRSPILAPENMEHGIFNQFIKHARLYFPVESTKEMLDEWRPLLCPYDMTFSKAIEQFELFLPTIVYPHEHELSHKLWANELLDIWISITTPHAWESQLISLFSRLACNVVGYFDWNPYIPHIFSYILRGFGLPIVSGTKGNDNLGITSVANMFSYSNSDVSSLCNWIVSMIDDKNECMDYLKRLFQVLRSFYYPSNTGRWSSNLYSFLRQLPEMLIKRKFREKKERHKWYGNTPVDSRLKETQITEFVNALKDAVFTAIFSKTNQTDAFKAYQSLCFLRPEICLPYLLDKIYNSIESLTEPHRFTSILNCLVLVSHELVTYNKFCPTMQSHVIPLLIAVLPGLDGNDTKKCLIAFQFLASVLSSIPIVNCTQALEVRDDLSEQERELCLSSAKFEDFIHEFFNKMFGLIETFSCEMSDLPMNYKNTNNVDDNIIEIGLSSTMNSLAQQSSDEYLKLMISKISNYMNGNVYNAKAGKLVMSVCRSLVKSARGDHAFKTFFTPLYGNLKRIRDSSNYATMLKNERGDIEISWNIQLFQELLRADGTILLNYIEQIKDIINWYMECTHKITIQYLCSAIRHLLRSLTFLYSKESRLTCQNYDFTDINVFKTQLPIRDWGRHGDLNTLNVTFHIPNDNELKTCISIVQTYTNIIMNNLETKGDAIHKDDRYRELQLLYNFIVGSARLLKRAKRPSSMDHIETLVDIGVSDDAKIGLVDLCDLSNLSDENIRETVATFLLNYTDKLLEKNTDDTKSLILVCKIFAVISILYGLFRTEFEKQWKVFQTIKKQFENKLHGKKSHARSLLIDRIILQYEYRIFHSHTKTNDLDAKIIDYLFKLSTSSYSEVRKEAQTQLFNLLAHYSFSYLILVPKICNLLTDQTINHDALKGCLYILKGNTLQTSLTTKHNWKIISKLWPVLFSLKYYEKPSIQKLLDSIHDNLQKHFDTFSYTTRLSDETVKLASEVFNLNENLHESDAKRLIAFENKSRESIQICRDLVSKIININKSSELTWRLQTISFGSLIYLLHPYGELSKEYIGIFVDSLVHDNIVIRKIALSGMCIILFMTKFKKPKTEVDSHELIKEYIKENEEVVVNVACPGERADNQWHHLNNKVFKLPETDNEWSELKLLDKTYYGYYCWASKVKVTQSKREIYVKNTEKSENMKPIYDNFTNEAYIQKLFHLFTIEGEKGREKFDMKVNHLFKGIFRNFGDMLIPNLIERLKALIRDRNKERHECSHKLASEICAALMRGSKYWPLSKLKQLWSDLNDVFELIAENLSPETLSFWNNAFSVSMEDQDPRRMVFFINFLKNLAIRKLNEEQSSSFQQSSCLLLLNALNQFEWRIPQIWTEISNALLPKMNHQYKSVREKLASCIAFSLQFDVNLPNSSQTVTTAPQIKAFSEYVIEKLDEAINLFKNVEDNSAIALSDEHKSAINFVHTLFTCLVTYFSRSLNPISYDIIKLVPRLCCLDNVVTSDETLKKSLNIVRSYISIWYMNEKNTKFFIQQIKLVLDNENWHSKLAAIHVLQGFGIFNLFHLSNETKTSIRDLVVKYLTDEQLEVRLACSLTLSAFIHSSLVQVDGNLINEFKKLSKTKAKNKDSGGKVVINTQNLIKRHGGILGLCSLVSSSPYEIPDYLPDIVTYLCAFINDTAPIQNTVRKCLSEFRRTHHDCWHQHQQYFTEDQLYTINDVLISPNYYA